MSTTDILRKVHDLLEKPESWTKRAWSRNNVGIEVNNLHPSACQWCLSAAVDWVCNADYNLGVETKNVLKQAISNRHPEFQNTIVGFNDDDNTTHSMMLEVVDDAIKISEGNPG